MKPLVLASLVVLCALWGSRIEAAETPNAKALREAGEYLGSCSAVEGEQRGVCDYERDEFVKNYLKAKAGQMVAQSNVAFMLAETSRRDRLPSVRANEVQACAWMFVVVGSGHAEAGQLQLDVLNLRCRRLDPAGQAMARARASTLIVEIKTSPTRPPRERPAPPRKGPLDSTVSPLQVDPDVAPLRK